MARDGEGPVATRLTFIRGNRADVAGQVKTIGITMMGRSTTGPEMRLRLSLCVIPQVRIQREHLNAYPDPAWRNYGWK